MKRLIVIAMVVVALVALVVSGGCTTKPIEPVVGSQGPAGPMGPVGPVGPVGAIGAKGESGADGVGVITASVNNSGHLILTLSNGATIDAGNVKGTDGKSGSSGYGYPGPQGPTGPQGEPGISGAFVILIAKDSTTWLPLTDGAVGYLLYEPVASQFNYMLKAYNLEPSISYTLIYYADYADRYNLWGGDNPGAVIAEGSSSSSGNLVLSGSVELGMDLPSPPDANISTHNYSGSPDYYAHAFGAKIWLVPTDCLTAGVLPVAVWSPTRFLFESDLIVYLDTDN